jgi:hypothetical protein
MAKLQSGDLKFDFRYTGFVYGWVQYQFYFRWKDESLARNDLLKKRGEYWGSRPDGAFFANEYEGDGLIPLLRKVLNDDKADYWEPMEPDIVIAIYPEDYFPFLPSHHKLIYERPDHKAKREAREALKKEKGKLPDDSYTLIVFVDAYNLKEADAYYGQGISLHMIVSRNELEAFAKDLEYEYQEFKQRFGVDQWLEENA